MGTRESYHDESSSEKKLLNETPWSEKAGPWWRTTDKDELASLVAQRSLDFVENCDLPTPQRMKRSCYCGSPREQWPSRAEEASSEYDLSKSELLEALRRSQTRAREAENMAKEACAEKEHLVKLLLKQASELFGYKQWLKLLYLQIKKIEEQQVVSVTWKARKQGGKGRRKRGKPSGLAWGMSLVGAGLVLGWTVGWMQMLSF